MAENLKNRLQIEVKIQESVWNICETNRKLSLDTNESTNKKQWLFIYFLLSTQIRKYDAYANTREITRSEGGGVQKMEPVKRACETVAIHTP